VGQAKTPVRVRSRRLGLSIELGSGPGSEEQEPTGGQGPCQQFIAQEKRLLRGRSMGKWEAHRKGPRRELHRSVAGRHAGDKVRTGLCGRNETKHRHLTRKDLPRRKHASKGRRYDWSGGPVERQRATRHGTLYGPIRSRWRPTDIVATKPQRRRRFYLRKSDGPHKTESATAFLNGSSQEMLLLRNP
jgi:hypothetical protein